MVSPASLLLDWIEGEIKKSSWIRGVDFDPRVDPLVQAPAAKVLKVGEPLVDESPHVIRDYRFEVYIYLSGIKKVTAETRNDDLVKEIQDRFGNDETDLPFRGVHPNKNNRIAFRVEDVVFLGKNVKTKNIVYLINMTLPVAPDLFGICE
jgi:hypothetical protein